MPKADIVERTLLGQGFPIIFACARCITKHMSVIPVLGISSCNKFATGFG
jgi:hypothetical protein